MHPSENPTIDRHALLPVRKYGCDFLVPMLSLVQCVEIAVADFRLPPFEDAWLERVLPSALRIKNLAELDTPASRTPDADHG